MLFITGHTICIISELLKAVGPSKAQIFPPEGGGEVDVSVWMCSISIVFAFFFCLNLCLSESAHNS